MGKARRGWGEGSLYRRKDGYWVAQVDAGRCPGGHERRDGTICKGGERRYARIVRRRKPTADELDDLKRRAGSGVAGKDYTVNEWVTWWLDNVKASEVSAATLADYRRWAKQRIKPHIGHIRLRKLTPVDVQRMMNGLEHSGQSRRGGKGHGPQARNAARTLLSSALKHARGLKLIVDNPADYVAGAKSTTRLDDALTDEEVDAVLAAARDDRLFALLYVAVTLGQRQGEQLRQLWTDLDLDDGTMRIDMAKTRAGERTLPLVAGTLDVLREHRAAQVAERLEAGPAWQDHGLVYCKADGRPISPRELVHWWHPLQEKAGIERRRWHALRHSAIGRMLDSGTPIEIVSAVAGHNSLSLTSDVYGRARTDRLRKRLAEYEAAIQSTGEDRA